MACNARQPAHSSPTAKAILEEPAGCAQLGVESQLAGVVPRPQAREGLAGECGRGDGPFACAASSVELLSATGRESMAPKAMAVAHAVAGEDRGLRNCFSASAIGSPLEEAPRKWEAQAMPSSDQRAAHPF